MLGQKLSCENASILLSFAESTEELVLLMINNNFFNICQAYSSGKQKLDITQFNIQTKYDDLSRIKIEIEKIIEKNPYKCQLIIFNEKFWFFYLNYYKSLKDFKTLREIEQIILKYKQKVDINLDLKKMSEIIHEVEIEMVKNGELKNEGILDFFENNYIKMNQKNFPFFLLME